MPTEPMNAQIMKTCAKEIEEMTNRFLQWPLPESVCADLCATKQGKGRIGTNLLTFTEAKAMLEAVAGPMVVELAAVAAAKERAEAATKDSLSIQDGEKRILLAEIAQHTATKAQLATSRETARRLAEALAIAKCPECDGSGVVVEVSGSTEYVSREMALDAGDPSLEGSVYREPKPEARQCGFCAMKNELLTAYRSSESACAASTGKTSA